MLPPFGTDGAPAHKGIPQAASAPFPGFVQVCANPSEAHEAASSRVPMDPFHTPRPVPSRLNWE